MDGGGEKGHEVREVDGNWGFSNHQHHSDVPKKEENKKWCGREKADEEGCRRMEGGMKGRRGYVGFHSDRKTKDRGCRVFARVKKKPYEKCKTTRWG